MFRQVSVRRPVPRGAMASGLDVIDRETVSGLDLPPALVFHVECDGQRRWITDPVELSRFVARHPQALVTVCGTDHLRRGFRN